MLITAPEQSKYQVSKTFFGSIAIFLSRDLARCLLNKVFNFARPWSSLYQLDLYLLDVVWAVR